MIKDNSRDWLKQSREDLAKRLEKGAIFLQNQIKTALSHKGTAGRNGKGQFTSGGRSQPGEYPFIDDGKLRQSITHDLDRDKLIARVGSPLLYARFLQMGTNKMEPRKLFQECLEENQGALKAIMAG